MLPFCSPKRISKTHPETHPKVDPVGSGAAANFSIYIYEINVNYYRL